MKITVISSFARDRLIKEDSIEERVGGPANFITRYLEKSNFPYTLYTGKRGEVEIDCRGGREQGKINEVGKIEVEQNWLPGLVLISTLLDEYTLEAKGDFCCVDIQGYVRDGIDFGRKKSFDSAALSRCQIVKGTEQELAYLTPYRRQTIPVIVVTRGSAGFQVVTWKKTFDFPVEKIPCRDTIGAGDTLFTAFCLQYYQSWDIEASADYARAEVNSFLQQKI